MTIGTKRTKDEQLLITTAETIGSTLGAIAARAEAAAKALGGRKLVRTAEQVKKALNRGKLPARLHAKRSSRDKSSSTTARNGRTRVRRARKPARRPSAGRRS